MSAADKFEDKFERLGWRIQDGAEKELAVTAEEEASLSAAIQKAIENVQAIQIETRSLNHGPTSEAEILWTPKKKDQEQDHEDGHSF